MKANKPTSLQENANRDQAIFESTTAQEAAEDQAPKKHTDSPTY